MSEGAAARCASRAYVGDALDAMGMVLLGLWAWTLRYAQYSVVVPSASMTVPLAVAMPRGEPELLGFVNTWLDLKRKDWSVIRDVLHWAE